MGEIAQLSTRQWIYDVVGYKAFKQNELGKTLYAKDVAAYLFVLFCGPTQKNDLCEVHGCNQQRLGRNPPKPKHREG